MQTQITTSRTQRTTPEERATRLYADGYRASLIPSGALLILGPAGQVYRVDPAELRCSCPASVTCKHIRGAAQLALTQADAMCWEGCALDVTASGEMVCDRGCWGYTSAGLGLRATAVDLYDAAMALRMWAQDLTARVAGAEGSRWAA